MNRCVELSVAAAVQNVDTALVNRRDSAIVGVSCADGKARKITGLLAVSADAGYFVGMIDGRVIMTIDALVIESGVVPIPLDIPIPAGSTFALYVHDTAGTAVANATVFYTEPD
jgi:hypothetical protein